MTYSPSSRTPVNAVELSLCLIVIVSAPKYTFSLLSVTSLCTDRITGTVLMFGDWRTLVMLICVSPVCGVEGLLEYLGCRTVRSLDYSAFEGAEIIYDLNKPVPAGLHDRFDVIFDGGTLEHVFDIPCAITSVKKMLRPNGLFLTVNAANNQLGHGFYQFSPELMFRIFTKSNGFALKRLLVTEYRFPGIELSSHGHAYELTDPEILGRRVGLISKGPVMMILEAKKIESCKLFGTTPLQSDYVKLWTQARAGMQDIPFLRHSLKNVFDKLPLQWQMLLKGCRQRWLFSLMNRKCYTRVK